MIVSKDIPVGYQKNYAILLLIFDGSITAREHLYTEDIIWVNTILNYIDTRTLLPRYEGSEA